MKEIKLNELIGNYKISDALVQAMLEAKKQGFDVYVSYLDRKWLNKIEYFHTDFNGLSGYVEERYFGGYSVDMPIKPSKEFGSQMWVGKQKDRFIGMTYEEMSEALGLLKNEYNTNNVVGRHKNYNVIDDNETRTLVIFE